MATRMQKYYDDNQIIHSRTERNKELYKEIASSEIDKFELSSNATILSDAKNSIDIEKIKKILDTKYKETPKRRSIRLEEQEEEKKISEIEDTKEYDINAILEKAKEEKETNYEQDRLKKLRDTQYNILNNLNLEGSEKEEPAPTQDDLMELINTITAKELENKKKGELDPLDILTDLKGDGEVTSPIEKEDIVEPVKDTMTKEETDLLLKTTAENASDEIDKSFFTTTSSFTESDFDDFNDLKAEVSSHKIIITVVVIVLMAIIVIAVILGLNHFLDLGLF